MGIPKMKRGKLHEDPLEEGEWMLKWLLHPIDLEEFYASYWQQKPLHIQRNDSNYWQSTVPTFSTSEFHQALQSNELYYGKNIDVTNYTEGKRFTFNDDGKRATVEHVKHLFEEKGYTLRILHPQEFSDGLYKICSTLQEWFGCVVGSNIYITPPKAQGFAPHYDDVDVFIVQLEGRKFWRLYHPIDESMELPEVSSDNFDQEIIGEPFMELWLEQGDILYFPRGIIHQALTDEKLHSMHVTVSTVQKWTWYHFLSEVLPAALRISFEEDIEFRKALPRRFQDFMGVMYSEEESSEREEFFDHAFQLVNRTLTNLPFDAAADQMAVKFLYDSLPPPNIPSAQQSKPVNLSSEVRLVSKSSVRIVGDEECILFYYNTKNSRVYHDVEPQYIEMPLESSDALEYLVNSFPSFVSVGSLPMDEDE